MSGIWQLGEVTATDVWELGSEGTYSAAFSIDTVGTNNVFADGATGIPVTGVDLDTVTSATLETDDGAYQVDVTASYSASDANNATFDHTRGALPLTTSSWQLRLALSDGTITSNALTNSKALDNAAWLKQFVTVSADAIAAPDATVTADTVVESTDAGEHFVEQSGLTLAAGDYVLTAFVKASGRTKGFITPVHTGEASSESLIGFDLTAGTIDAPGAGLSTATHIKALANGWYFISVSYSLTGATTDHRARLQVADGAGASSYTGDGTSGLHFWKVQQGADSFVFVSRNITINPASGYQVVEMAGTLVLSDPESAFAPYTGPDPVVMDQYIVPDVTTAGAPITANADTTLAYDYSAIDPVPVDDTHAVEWWSSDGTDRVWSSGTITVGSAPAGTVTVGTITVAETTADVPFTYDATDQDSFEYRLDGGAWTAAVSPINLTGLTGDTTYLVEVRAVNSYGTSDIASKSFTTSAASSPPAGTITFGIETTTGSSATIPFTYDLTDQTGFAYRVDSGSWISIADSPVELTGLTTGTTYTVSVRAVNDDGVGTTYSTSVTTDAALASPAGTVTFGAPSVTQDTISQPFTYDDTDETGFEYRVNGGAWVALASSPVSLTGLSTGTTYQIEVRAVNNDGEGSTASTNVTTEGLNPPQGVITFGTISVTTNAATVPFTYDLDDETGFEYSLDGGPFTVTTSPVGLTGLDPATSYNLEVRAVNADGPGTAFPTTVTTEALAPPQGEITFGTPTVGQTTATVPFTYSLNDQTGFEYQVNGGSFIALAASPVDLTGLTPDTVYNVNVRAVNNEGNGSSETLAITTLAEQSSTPGQTSGTYAFNMQVDEIIEDAYERIGQESVSGYDLRTARRSLNILLTEWVNKEITLWTMERRSIQCVAGQAEYALRERDVDVFEVAVRTSGADLVLSRVSWDQSMYTVDKTQSGRPIQYKFDRQITPKLVLWPVPDTSTLSLVVDVFKYIEDVGDYFNVIGAPRRFLPAMIAGLAYYLAEKKAPNMVAQKKQMYDEALMYALSADEEVKSFTVRPSRGRYRRR